MWNWRAERDVVRLGELEFLFLAFHPNAQAVTGQNFCAHRVGSRLIGINPNPQFGPRNGFGFERQLARRVVSIVGIVCGMSSRFLGTSPAPQHQYPSIRST